MSATNEKNVGEETPLQEPSKGVAISSTDNIASAVRRSDEITGTNEAASINIHDQTSGFTKAESLKYSNSDRPISSANDVFPPISHLSIGRLYYPII